MLIITTKFLFQYTPYIRANSWIMGLCGQPQPKTWLKLLVVVLIPKSLLCGALPSTYKMAYFDPVSAPPPGMGDVFLSEDILEEKGKS